MNKSQIKLPDADIDPKKIGSSSFSASSERTSVTVDSRSIPLEAVQAVLLHLSPKEPK